MQDEDVKKPYTWQNDCLKSWLENDCRGIVNVATGAGKTFFAICAIKQLQELINDELVVMIVVPQIVLLVQWTKALKQELAVKSDDIGLHYGKIKQPPTHKFTLYIVNTARNCIARHILEHIKNGKTVLLIADECHHYSSVENYKMFDFLPLADKAKYCSLGLSATPGTNERLETALGKEIFKFNISSSIKAGVVSDFTLYNISLKLSDLEQSEYELITKRISKLIIQLEKCVPQIIKVSPDNFFETLQKLAVRGSENIKTLAVNILVQMSKRREISYLASSRVDCAVEIIKRLHSDKKIIVFCQRISTTTEIYNALEGATRNETSIYHSKITARVRHRIIEEYSSGKIRILLCCRALDEGLNIPETDVAIVVSSGKNIRQQIQRTGRVLRVSKNNSGPKNAAIYHQFIPQINESPSLLSAGARRCYDISFDCENFDFPEYSNTCKKALLKISKTYSHSFFAEAQRNFELGLLRNDIGLSRKQCTAKIENATGKAQRNYYVSMLMLIESFEENSD